MRIKQHLFDFRVRELLVDGYAGPKGAWRVYRVSKRKCTSLEAADVLARALGVPPSEVTMAGLKDRQGVTVQHMAVRHGKPLEWRDERVWIADAGAAAGPLSAAASRGNAFEIVVRAMTREDLGRLRANVPFVREHGVVNYFDEQRFGNVRHRQGWIARDLMRGKPERALKVLLTAVSPHENPRELAFKSALDRSWGDWVACREAAGRFGRHHSLFEFLKKNPDDFAGAFYHVPSRLRLIHLFAWQSHVWNRAVSDWVTSRLPAGDRIAIEGVEGLLVQPARPLALDPSTPRTFRLPGDRLEGVTDSEQRVFLEDVLARERMVADEFRITGVSGFQLKGEDRPLFVTPGHLRVRPPEPDRMNRGLYCVRVRFELPRGAYATLVVRRLVSSPEAPAGRLEGGERRDPDDRGRRGGRDAVGPRGGDRRRGGDARGREQGGRDDHGSRGGRSDGGGSRRRGASDARPGAPGERSSGRVDGGYHAGPGGAPRPADRRPDRRKDQGGKGRRAWS